ncbi:MAG: hypothetical protein AUJ86_09745 [Hydrogenophilaceae bacterium CG1_02_62_390]|nr:hypothetical protein [Betaproteobacteria bacterium]OIO77120.1 MAG: hypothetical protein AUJ86_09745 [Hydrogenophilaceae bacterium CG1_02_62_390]PIW37517.1 MAG: hypothetical protein COW23_11430 [Hydrogenophilales bacterium CG15_BIG_FIL_POST_REV_8_21_14_020_62_31]PIW72557.1 MAG: hypothetical protein COW07_02290 [Hydrogenophilales bacterium CG12_big_fil_rev_8_21_14_0_65_61_21]PIY98981.1 MAG: hypothetical protein COY64_03250 [Hydrogenophilales bacterium CG_4_10_14_0_8_um_filter_62_70]
MKYDSASKTLEFSSDAEVVKFHNQLTEVMRAAMSAVGDIKTNEVEAAKLTMEFFERYSALTDTLSRLRAHLPRSVGAP